MLRTNAVKYFMHLGQSQLNILCVQNTSEVKSWCCSSTPIRHLFTLDISLGRQEEGRGKKSSKQPAWLAISEDRLVTVHLHNHNCVLNTFFLPSVPSSATVVSCVFVINMANAKLIIY